MKLIEYHGSTVPRGLSEALNWVSELSRNDMFSLGTAVLANWHIHEYFDGDNCCYQWKIPDKKCVNLLALQFVEQQV